MGLATGVNQIVPAHGSAEVDLGQFDAADNYGFVTVQAQNSTIVAWTLRVRGDEYVIPTPVRQ